jgi:hypothetical protein
MLLCDNYNGGYHLFCLKSKLTQVFTFIWYCSSCSLTTPWFLFKSCHVFFQFRSGGDTWEFHLSLLLCIVYTCACISFQLISFYLWLVLIFLFNRVYYGFTPLWNRTSQQLSCSYAWPNTWWPITNMPIVPLGLIYVFRILYVIRCFRVMACLGFHLCWQLHKRPTSSFFSLVFIECLCHGEFLPVQLPSILTLGKL